MLIMIIIIFHFCNYSVAITNTYLYCICTGGFYGSRKQPERSLLDLLFKNCTLYIHVR